MRRRDLACQSYRQTLNSSKFVILERSEDTVLAVKSFLEWRPREDASGQRHRLGLTSGVPALSGYRSRPAPLRIERLPLVEHAKRQLDQFAHGCPHDRHRTLPAGA